MIIIRVLIDADGCPVTDIALKLCKNACIPCLILCDTAHEFHREGAETYVFDKGADSVDLAIANLVRKEDLVITQDYGLACICLAKGCRALHQDGWEYTSENIDALLLVRHESQKHRASGRHFKGPKKRTHQQDDAFAAALQQILQTSVQG